MPGESEYHRSYKPLDGSDEQLAGLSSAKLAVTQEPAFARKRKPPDHGRKVTFITDYTEHGAPLVSGPDKAMYFRAGLRRAETMVPTEYQLQYRWKEPVQESPLLNAENMLYHSKNHTNRDSGEGQGGRPFNNTNQNGNQDAGAHSPPHKHQRHTHSSAPVVGYTHDEPTTGGDNAGREKQHRSNENAPNREKAKKQLAKERQQKLEHTNSHQSVKKSDELKHKRGNVQLQKQSAKKMKQKKSRHFKSKMTAQVYTTEYRSQFKEKKEGHKTSGKADAHPPPVAGQPPILTDQTDPRLLKHLPLPINKLFYLPSTKWGSEYSSNFMAPEEFEFERGVWKGASQPDLLAQPVHQASSKEEKSESPISSKNSWFDQLLELRKKADDFKKRAQTTHFLPHRPLALRHNDLLDSTSTSSTLTLSETPTSPTSTASTVSEIPRTFEHQRSSRMNGYVGASPVLKRRAVPNLNGAEGGMRVEDVEESDTETVTSEQSSSVGSSDSEKIPQRIVSTGHTQTKFKAKSGIRIPHQVGVSKLIPHGSPQGKGQSSKETQETEEGRVDTPRLVKSRSDHRRHHLDVTTPAGGGLLISPTKRTHSNSDGDEHPPIQLPFPPTSPKFRKDMKSSALIFPSPTQKKSHVVSGEDFAHYEGSHSKRKSVPVSSNVEPRCGPNGVESRNGTQNMGPRSIPISSSPYHIQCTSDPPATAHHKHGSDHPIPTGDGGPVRKLVFDGRKSQPVSTSKMHTQHHHHALSQLQQHKHQPSLIVDTCKTCGAHLRSSSSAPTHTHTHTTSFSQQQRTKHQQPVSSSIYSKSAPRSTTVGGVSHAQHLYQHRPVTMSQPRPLIQRTPHGTVQQPSEMFQSSVAQPLAKPTVRSLSSNGQIPDSGIGSSRRVMLAGGEGRGCDAGEPSVISQDCDTLSLSSLSLSTCSVASDILKKARDRRDHFWARPRVAAT